MKQVRLADVAEIKFSAISPGRTKSQETPTRWLACANFLRNNTIVYDTTETYYAPEKELLIKTDDIVVKRITPTFVNYIDYMPDDVYAGNNLIVISPKQEVYVAQRKNTNIIGIEFGRGCNEICQSPTS